MTIVRDDLPVEAPWLCVERPRRGSAQPVLQVRRVDDATYLLRQGCATTWEAPVLALLLGTRRALLLDSGAVSDTSACPLADTVDALVREWCSRQGLSSLEIVVAHTHGHNDHTAGDNQFLNREGITVVGKDGNDVRKFFSIDPWPDTVTDFDLGDREVHVTGAPGHDPRSIVVVDPSRQLMFSGDTAYPGRLYADDLAALKHTLVRLVDLAERFGIERVVGCHVERDSSGEDFLPGARFHVNEPPLSLTVEDLRAIERTVAHARRRGVTPGTPMSVYAGPCIGPMTRLALRGIVARIRGRGPEPRCCQTTLRTKSPATPRPLASQGPKDSRETKNHDG